MKYIQAPKNPVSIKEGLPLKYKVFAFLLTITAEIYACRLFSFSLSGGIIPDDVSLPDLSSRDPSNAFGGRDLGQ